MQIAILGIGMIAAPVKMFTVWIVVAYRYLYQVEAFLNVAR